MVLPLIQFIPELNNSAPLGSFPGREGNFVIAGKLTNMVYGFVIGMFLIMAAMPILTAMGVL